MNKKIRIEDTVQKNTQEIDGRDGEINRSKKLIRKRKQKNRKHHELSLELDGLENFKTRIINNIDKLKQTILETEVKTRSIRIKKI